MEIINIFKDYQFQDKNPLNQYNYWLNYMKQFTEIKRKCIEDYLFNKYDPKEIALEKVFIYSKLEFEKMKVASKKIEQICKALENKKNNIIDVSTMPIVVIIYHGLGNAAGWATKYKGNPAIMLGVEKIVELGWDDKNSLQNLIYHEYAHLIHEYLRNTDLEPFNDNYKVWINRVYIEGFATYLESILSGTTRRNDWLKKCEEKASLLKEEILYRLSHQLSCQEFFGDWHKVYGLSDTGYFLGFQYIKSLSKFYDIKYIAKMSIMQIEEGLMKFLNDDELIK
ncbi:MAG: DUF2268 domain-containing putative Zn-dependent protease [Tenericutes bacterium]|jgi:hypothetical protein|nr:DUF2268 domain-containing putative Zn-dependent protease [Mycoplasmatota bacterium]